MQLDFSTLESIINGIKSKRIGLIGDGCVDIYWKADMRMSLLSSETPHHPLPIVSEKIYPGGAGNVAANLRDLGVGQIFMIGCTGPDWRGTLFAELMRGIGVPDRYLVCSSDIVTAAYCKPVRMGVSNVEYEDPRLDFANPAPISEEIEAKILANLEEVAAQSDVLVVCDQLLNGCVTERVIERINELGKKLPVIVDSRDRFQRFRNVIIKPNELEAGRYLGTSLGESAAMEDIEQAVRSLERMTGRPAMITLGDRGALWCEEGLCSHMRAFSVLPPIDFVGAGDAFLAGFSSAFGLVPPQKAVLFANLAASVTIKKLGTTGTATPEELREALACYPTG